jgi:hypothetical protein
MIEYVQHTIRMKHKGAKVAQNERVQATWDHTQPL